MSTLYTTKVDKNKVDKFETGAQRSAQSGRGRYDLIPTRPLKRVAVKYEQGAQEYGERNWEKGMKFSRLLNSATRHIQDYISGDRSEDHLAAAIWNCMGVMEFEEVKPHLDDLPEGHNMDKRKVELSEPSEPQTGCDAENICGLSDVKTETVQYNYPDVSTTMCEYKPDLAEILEYLFVHYPTGFKTKQLFQLHTSLRNDIIKFIGSNQEKVQYALTRSRGRLFRGEDHNKIWYVTSTVVDGQDIFYVKRY